LVKLADEVADKYKMTKKDMFIYIYIDIFSNVFIF